MTAKMELIGKTISSVVAARDIAGEPCRIWMLQFTDGTHVEFVSPTARRRLEKQAGSPQLPLTTTVSSPQLSLRVA